MKVLVVNDNPDIHDLFRLILAQYEVFHAMDGAEGYEVAMQDKPDLIYIDLIMPNVNGLNLARKLKKNKDTKDIPLVLITGYVLPPQKKNDYFEKHISLPIDINEIRKYTETIMARYYPQVNSD